MIYKTRFVILGVTLLVAISAFIVGCSTTLHKSNAITSTDSVELVIDSVAPIAVDTAVVDTL